MANRWFKSNANATSGRPSWIEPTESMPSSGSNWIKLNRIESNRIEEESVNYFECCRWWSNKWKFVEDAHEWKWTYSCCPWPRNLAPLPSQRRRRNFRWHQICFCSVINWNSARPALIFAALHWLFGWLHTASGNWFVLTQHQIHLPSRPHLPSGLLTSVASPSAPGRCPGSSSHSRSVCSDESRGISKISVER